jgi:hypothetical protein
MERKCVSLLIYLSLRVQSHVKQKPRKKSQSAPHLQKIKIAADHHFVDQDLVHAEALFVVVLEEDVVLHLHFEVVEEFHQRVDLLLAEMDVPALHHALSVKRLLSVVDVSSVHEVDRQTVVEKDRLALVDVVVVLVVAVAEVEATVVAVAAEVSAAEVEAVVSVVEAEAEVEAAVAV